ncbi:MAG: outer membrane lipid asymmetry maintenance protein MlaD [Francisellaceae bacterium]
MDKKQYEMIVGIFVLAGMLALAFLALKVSGLSYGSFNQKSYTVTVEFSNIGSLKAGAAVRIAGVEVGSVESVDLSSNYNGFVAEVKLAINRKFDKIPSSYSAAIETSGILGDSFVALAPAIADLPGLYDDGFLKNGSTISVTNTQSALNLNALINTFVAGSGDKK